MLPVTLADHIIFGLLVFALPLVAIIRTKPRLIQIPDNTRIKVRLYLVNSAVLWLGAIVVVVLWLATGRDFAALGFQWPDEGGFPEWMLLTAFFILLYMFDTFFAWHKHSENPAQSILPSNWKEFAYFGSVVSVSAGVCEEIVFRGFVVTYALTVFDNTSYPMEIAIIGSAIVFGLLHAYQGWQAIVKIVFLSMLFAWVFALSRSLLIVVVLHFAIDFLGGLLSVLRIHQKSVNSGYDVR